MCEDCLFVGMFFQNRILIFITDLMLRSAKLHNITNGLLWCAIHHHHHLHMTNTTTIYSKKHFNYKRPDYVFHSYSLNFTRISHCHK